MNQPVSESAKLRKIVESENGTPEQQEQKKLAPQQLFEAFQLLDNPSALSNQALVKTRGQVAEDFAARFMALPIELRARSAGKIQELLKEARRNKRKEYEARLRFQGKEITDSVKAELTEKANQEVTDIPDEKKMMTPKNLFDDMQMNISTPEEMANRVWDSIGNEITSQLNIQDYRTAIDALIPSAFVLKQLTAELHNREDSSEKNKTLKQSYQENITQARKEKAILLQYITAGFPTEGLDDEATIVIDKVKDFFPVGASLEEQKAIFQEQLEQRDNEIQEAQEKMEQLSQPAVASEMLNRQALDEFDIEGLEMQERVLPMMGIQTEQDLMEKNGATAREAIFTFKWLKELQSQEGEERRIDIERDYPASEDPTIQKRAMYTRMLDYAEHPDLLLLGSNPEDYGFDGAQIDNSPEVQAYRLSSKISFNLDQDVDAEPETTQRETRNFREYDLPKMARVLLLSRLEEGEKSQEAKQEFLSLLFNHADLFEEGSLTSSARQLYTYVDQAIGGLKQEDLEEFERLYNIQQKISDQTRKKEEHIRSSFDFTKDIFGKLQEEELQAQSDIQKVKEQEELEQAIGRSRPSGRLIKMKLEDNPNEKLKATQRSTRKVERIAAHRLSDFDAKLQGFDADLETLRQLKASEISRLATKFSR